MSPPFAASRNRPENRPAPGKPAGARSGIRPLKGVCSYLEINVLSVRDQKWSIKVLKTQRFDETGVVNISPDTVGNLNSVSDALLLHPMPGADEQNLARLVAKSVLQSALPVLPAAQSGHVRPYFMAGRCQSRPKLDGEPVFLRIGVADE